MSVMGGENVDVAFNITGNAGASLSQLIAQSEQYAKASDTLLGRVASLNVATTQLITRTTALTGANKIATAEAAAYQQRLSGIEATALATSQSFGQLEKMTLGLARSMPGGIGEAVKYVETLQRSGVTTAKSIGTLAESMRDLGAANGLDGAYIGKQLLTINRMFGNSDESLRKYGDTLTTLGAKFGASADGTAAFAKALAPVAASVGMSETAVLGLGAAASRLGEDGYASANAFNRVLLDMRKSIRDGSPEIKEYAGLLGMSATGLSRLFREDPTEVLVKFTEAVRKGGTEASRTLDVLGLDSVRTIKSIQALSSQGNLRQIVDEAVGAYGNDSTAKAAEAALGGVNDEAAKLSETLSQTVAAAGKPFLDFLNAVLKGANAASGAIAGLMQSDVMQGVGKVGAVASFGSQVAGNMLTAGLGTAMLMRGGRFAVDQARFFRTGVGEARAGMGPYPGAAAEDMPAMMRAGSRWGEFMPVALMGAGPAVGAGNVVRQAWRTSMATAGALMQSNTNLMNINGDPVRSAAYQKWLDDLKAVKTSDLTWGEKALERSRLTREAMAAGIATESGVGKVAGKGIGQYAQAAGLLASTAGAGLSKAAPLLFNPYTGVAAAAAGAGYLAYRVKSDQDEYQQLGASGWEDAYGQFNEFAAAAGEASKGLVSFTDAVAKSTQTLAKENKSLADAFTLSAEERANATAGGYQRAFTAVGDDVASRAMSARLMLGTDATPSQVARVGSDLANQYGLGEAQRIIDELKRTQNADPLSLIAPALEAYAGNMGFWGETRDSGEIMRGLTGAQSAFQANAISTYGDAAAGPSGLAFGVEAMNAAFASGNDDQKRAAARVFAEGAGVDFGRFLTETNQGRSSLKDILAKDWKDTPVEERRSDVGEETYAFASQMAELKKKIATWESQGWSMDRPGDFSMLATTPEQQRAVASRMQAGGFGLSGLSTAATLYGADRRAADLGVAGPAQLREDQLEGLSEASKAIAAWAKESTPANLLKAGTLFAASITDRTGSANRTISELKAIIAGSPTGSREAQIANAALVQTTMQAGVESAGMSRGKRWEAAEAAGKAALNIMTSNPEAADDPGLKADLEAWQSAQAEKIDLMKQFNAAAKNLDIQLTRQEDDARLTRKRANRDFDLQMQYAEKDNYKTRARAGEDFHKQMRRAEEDFNTSRFRATRDFNKQMARAAEDGASSLYDPYKRIAAKQVWDARSLAANRQGQLAALRKQVQQIAVAKKLGLSQDTIDQLDLTNPNNAQQLDRLIQDLQASPSQVGELNRLSGQIKSAGKALTQDESNKDYRRQVEDFRTSMSDADKDFTKQRKRAREDFTLSMSRAATDFETQMGRAAKAHETAMRDMNVDLGRSVTRAKRDLLRFADDVTTDYEDTVSTFAANIAAIPDKLRPSMSQSLQALANAAGTDLDSFLKLVSAKYMPPGGTLPPVPQTTTQRKAAEADRRSSVDDPGRAGFGVSGQTRAASGAVLMGPRNIYGGEAGPEAVVPLDARGIGILADALRQAQVKAAATARYATPTSHYQVHYDQRTQINGPIKVVAQDPNAMARALEAKARAARLTAPVSAR